MKKILFLCLGIFNLSFAQNTIQSDSINQLKEVIVTYKANKLTPITYQDITESEIKQISIGQEPSFLLSTTPSIIAHSDGGHNQGYSYFTLRGIDQTRINITLDGVPLNDPADQAFYFSNYADILNSVSQIQIQRGVGTSKNGTASYAGSIELFSPNLYNREKLEFGVGYGSFNTLRTFGIYNSGIKNKKGLYLRLSKIYSDGFKQHASNNSQSLFLSAGVFWDKSTWKINLLAGKQKNELAWMGVSENEIYCDRTINGNSEFETDDFSQILMHVNNKWNLNKNNTINSSIYYTIADGWWNFDYPNYMGETATEADIFTNSIKSDLIGFFSNHTWHKKNFKITTGVHGNTYQNKFSEIHTQSGDVWDSNSKYKDEISAFHKMEYKLNGFLFFGDIQYRTSWFDYDGNMKFKYINWTFINPKFGLSYKLSNYSTLYLNTGRTGREPSRYDMFQGNDILLYLCPTDINGNYIIPELGNTLIASIDPEYVIDYEIGSRTTFKDFIFNINYYYLKFENERVLNGSYGPNGLALTSNVDKSIRTGIEFFGEYNINRNLKLINNSSYNYSIIKQQNIEFTPILTPPIIINQELRYSKNQLSISISARYQSASYMNFENTMSLNDYILINGRIDYQIRNYFASVFINNITDNFYFNNGFVDWDGSNKYFVQAPRNIYVSLRCEF